jgi:hypothetical protein
MDAMQFEQQAKADSQLRDFLTEVAEEVAEQVAVEAPERFVTVTGADMLFSVAAYALFRWAKDFFDNRRARNETAVAQQQQELIAALIVDGFPPKEAQAAAIALLNGIAKRTQDDPALKKAQALLGKKD